MATETYMCEFCAEDFEAETDSVLCDDDRDGVGLLVYFCCTDHRRRYMLGEDA